MMLVLNSKLCSCSITANADLWILPQNCGCAFLLYEKHFTSILNPLLDEFIISKFKNSSSRSIVWHVLGCVVSLCFTNSLVQLCCSYDVVLV